MNVCAWSCVCMCETQRKSGVGEWNCSCRGSAFYISWTQTASSRAQRWWLALHLEPAAPQLWKESRGQEREKTEMTKVHDREQMSEVNLGNFLPKHSQRNFKNTFISIRVVDTCSSFLIPGCWCLVPYSNVWEIKLAEFLVCLCGEEEAWVVTFASRWRNLALQATVTEFTQDAKLYLNKTVKGGCSRWYWCTVQWKRNQWCRA